MSGSSALSGANPTIYGSPVSVESGGSGPPVWMMIAGAGAILLMAYLFSRRK